MKQYAILIGDEDGNCFKPVSSNELKDIVQVMEDYGVEKFIPVHADEYPDNWPDNEAVLIEYVVKIPKPVLAVTKYELD